MTDAELDLIEAKLADRYGDYSGALIDRSSNDGGPAWIDNPLHGVATRLLAEVRRLRALAAAWGDTAHDMERAAKLEHE